MSHYGPGIRKIRETPREWLRPGAQMGKQINAWAGRDDLVVFVGSGAGRNEAAALFDPFIAEVEINPEPAFGKVDPKYFGDFRDRNVWYEYPAGTGAAYHEAMHARFTTWDLKEAAEELSGTENDALHNLEEGRIEKLGVLHDKSMRPFLRSCALDIVLADMTDKKVAKLSQTRVAARGMALVMARVDAGVLKPEDTDFIRPKIMEILGEDLAEQLRDIYLEFQTIRIPDTKRMYLLAREWDKLVQDEAEKRGEGQQEVVFVIMPKSGDEDGQGSGDGDEQDGQGSGSDSDSDSDSGDGDGEEQSQGGAGVLQEILKALTEDKANAEEAGSREAEQQQAREKAERRAQEKAAEAQESREHQKEASKVFGIGPGPTGAATRSYLVEKRPPESAERVAAVRVARELEKAKYRDAVKTMVSSAAPPGRLRTREALQGVALKSKGIRAENEPWRRQERKRVDEPKLKLGVMTDISASMTEAMEPMGVSAWVMSEAVRRIQGEVAMVAYGNDVFPTLMPREHLPEVRIYQATDNAHAFDKAFKAINGTLGLLNGTGARLLVVCSDGHYGSTEGAACQRWLQRCKRAGVAVLWIGYSLTNDDPAKAYCEASGAQYVYVGQDVVGAAMTIGRVAADALTRLGNRG